MLFADRSDAGNRLALRLVGRSRRDTVVLGLPRGGVPVAFEVARALGAALDVVLVRKLGVPSQPELAMGAIGEGGVRIVNREVVRATGVTDFQMAVVEAAERSELERRARRFRGGHPQVPLVGHPVVVVDDGLATGSTARAACRVARAHGATTIVLAVPLAPPGWGALLCGVADELVSLETPDPFFAIGQFYDDFSQITDEEVVHHLEEASRWSERGVPPR